MFKYYMYIFISIIYIGFDTFFLSQLKVTTASLQLNDSVIDYAIGSGASTTTLIPKILFIWAAMVLAYSIVRLLEYYFSDDNP